MEAKLKHLEFIQNIITRMNSNSFMLKGWCITLVSALFALSAKDSNTLYILITYIPIPLFWILDGYYLSQERQYRDLYKEVSNIDNVNINFSLNATSYNTGKNTWTKSIVSNTLILFYVTMLLTVIVIMFFIKYFNTKQIDIIS